MKKIVFIFIVFAIMLSLCAVPANASNTYIYDESECITNATKQYINEINDDPHNFVVVIVKETPSEKLDGYAQKCFSKYGLDDSKNSYDVVVVFDIEKARYDIVYGGGYNQNMVLRSDLMVNLISEDELDLLNDKDYDNAILSIAQNFNKMMDMVDSGEYARKEAIRIQRVKRAESITVVVAIIGSIIAVGYYLFKNRKNSTIEQKSCDEEKEK